MNLKAKVERDENFPIKKVNNCTHFFERVYKTKEVRQQKSTKSIKHQKSSKSNKVKPTKKFKNAKELINLKEVKNTKEVKTHILVFLLNRMLSSSLLYFGGEVRSTITITIPLCKQLQLALSVASAAIF